jgi:membrane protease YdiL (CAAX protease family)
MKAYLQRIDIFFGTLKSFQVVLLFVIANATTFFVISRLVLIYRGVELKSFIDKTNLDNQLSFMFFGAPFLETTIFQYGIIELLSKRIALKYACFCSAIAFALIHYSSPYYVLYGLLSGLIFAYLYLIGRPRGEGFAMVFVAHMLVNMVIYLRRFL